MPILDTFLADPSEVPRSVVADLARQPDIAGTGDLKRYAAGEMRRDHVTEIRRSYGYRDFHEGAGATALADGLRFLAPVRTLNAGPNPKYVNTGRGVTYDNFTSDQFTGFHAIKHPPR